jgi:hypothetical protein
MQAWGGVPPGEPYASPLTQEAELSMLKAQAEDLTEALKGIKQRIEELESESKGG